VRSGGLSLDQVFELIPNLKERLKSQGTKLSGGEQQMLAIGRALVAGPRMLMLDEPSMGLAPLIVAQIMQVIKEVNQHGTTVLLVEQNARAALRITDRGYVLENGAITIEGSGTELMADARIVEAYLGA
jgi:branched-chain amino acid transport system ATP-binding protein